MAEMGAEGAVGDVPRNKAPWHTMAVEVVAAKLSVSTQTGLTAICAGLSAVPFVTVEIEKWIRQRRLRDAA